MFVCQRVQSILICWPGWFWLIYHCCPYVCCLHRQSCWYQTPFLCANPYHFARLYDINSHYPTTKRWSFTTSTWGTIRKILSDLNPTVDEFHVVVTLRVTWNKQRPLSPTPLKQYWICSFWEPIWGYLIVWDGNHHLLQVITWLMMIHHNNDICSPSFVIFTIASK